MRQLVASLGRLDDAVNAAAEEATREAPAPAEVSAAMDPNAPMVQLVESLIAQAARSAASDIHLDATDDGMDVSFRIDGVLGSVAQLPAEVAAAAVSRVKVMCELDISEKRSPQEGRTTVSVDSRPIDLHVVTLPLVTGESLTIWLLVRGAEAARAGQPLDRHDPGPGRVPAGGHPPDAGQPAAWRDLPAWPADLDSRRPGHRDGGRGAQRRVGCGRCGRSGYRGRRGVFEIMPVDEPIREAIAAGATADAIRRLASEAGMRPLRENGLAKVASGETSLAEVARATG
jgi:type II secretory ATPase GspE/PulE/Tfp pilus assembly ATPase PilB-like protein